MALFAFSLVLISLAFLSLLVNILALLVLQQRVIRSEFGKFRVHLIFISTAEITCSALYAFTEIFRLVMSLTSSNFTPLFLMLFYAAFCSNAARNWAVALVTLARAEIVIRPLRSRTRKLFNVWRIVLITTGVSTVLLIYYWIIIFVCHDCFNSLLQIISTNIIARSMPIILVITGTVAISVNIQCCRQRPQSHQRRAETVAKTVVVLGVLFTIFEGATDPILVYTLTMTSGVPSDRLILLSYCSSLLAVLNSLSNIFAFGFSSEKFRQETRKVMSLHCQRRIQIERDTTLSTAQGESSNVWRETWVWEPRDALTCGWMFSSYWMLASILIYFTFGHQLILLPLRWSDLYEHAN